MFLYVMGREFESWIGEIIFYNNRNINFQNLTFMYGIYCVGVDFHLKNSINVTGNPNIVWSHHLGEIGVQVAFSMVSDERKINKIIYIYICYHFRMLFLL